MTALDIWGLFLIVAIMAATFTLLYLIITYAVENAIQRIFDANTIDIVENGGQS